MEKTARDIIEEAYKIEDNRDLTAEYMAELLMDDSNSSYEMFEELVSSYLNGNTDYRNGLNAACSILTGYNLQSIAEEIIEKSKEAKEVDRE